MKRCAWCQVGIRERFVLVGPPPGRPVRMFIDSDADVCGTVLERRDGKFRLLTDARADRARGNGTPLFRIHGEKTCAVRPLAEGRHEVTFTARVGQRLRIVAGRFVNDGGAR